MLHWKCKRKQSDPLGKPYCRYVYDILSEICLNDASIDMHQIWCLLRTGKVVELY